MHIKDISIKTRLIISNILMLIIPCSLVVIITAVIFTGFVYRFDGTDVRTQLTDSLGFISVYQLQFHVNQLEKEVLQTGENVSEQEEIVSMCKELEDTGALVAILFDNVPAYSTPGYTLEEWETEVEKIASGANFDEDSLLYTSSRGTILSTVTHAADGRRLCILICDPTLVSVVASTTEDLPKRAFEYMDTMGWVLSASPSWLRWQPILYLSPLFPVVSWYRWISCAARPMKYGTATWITGSIMREKTSLAMCARILMRCA